MSHVEAIFRGGVFQPLEPVNLSEEQRVHLSFDVANGPTALVWLNKVEKIQAAIITRQGVLSDSAADIAADRTR